MSETINRQDFYERTGEVDLSLLDSGPYSVRKTLDEKKLEQLTNSIRQGGVDTAIAVSKKGDGRYEIIYGNRRVLGSKRADKKTIIAKIYSSALPVEEREVMSCIENAQREDLTAEEMADIIERVVKSCGESKQKAGLRLGLSPREIQQWLNYKATQGEMPDAKVEHVSTADFIKTHFDRSLWNEKWNNVKGFPLEDQIPALKKLVKGGNPDDVFTALATKEKKAKPKVKGWFVQCRITDSIANRAIDSAVGEDGVTKPDFLVAAAIAEVKRRGIYQRIVKKIEEEQSKGVDTS
jgi:ParB/RepB/Spo0J family partition protein